MSLFIIVSLFCIFKLLKANEVLKNWISLFISLVASPAKIPTLSCSCLSASLWIPITNKVLNCIIGEPEEPHEVGILW